MNYQIPLWGSLIISNMHNIAGNNWIAFAWVAMGIFVLVIQYKDN